MLDFLYALPTTPAEKGRFVVFVQVGDLTRIYGASIPAQHRAI